MHYLMNAMILFVPRGGENRYFGVVDLSMKAMSGYLD